MNTKLSHHLAIRTIDNKAISLSPQDTGTMIRLLGSTFPTSVQADGHSTGHPQVTLYPEKGQNGLVAVAVVISHNPKAMAHFISAFLEVTWKNKDGNDYPFVDLDKPWISADRVGQTTSHDIEVMLPGGKRFCTYDHFGWKHNEGKNLPTCVPDGDLLCRYLWGTAHASDVLHAAVQHKLEPTAKKRVEELTNEVRRFQAAQSVWIRNMERISRSVVIDRRRAQQNHAAAQAYEEMRRHLAKAGPLGTLLKHIPERFRPKMFDGLIAALDVPAVRVTV